MSLIGALDQGTSSTRFIVFSNSGRAIASCQREHTQYYPAPGRVEHDPEELWQNTVAVIEGALSALPAGSPPLAAVGITNQRETTIVWNRATGTPYHNAIVWNDSRTAAICERICEGRGKDIFRAKTGLPVAPYFSASKLVYLLETVPGLREDAERGDALFGTVDCFLIWRLTGRVVHATDVTNASRTLLMDLRSLQWDDELLRIFNIPRRMLPQIRPSSGLFGEILAIPQLRGTRISGVLGDQQAALFGQACFDQGDTKATYGTGCFILMNTGPSIVPSECGLITTVAYQCSAGVADGGEAPPAAAAVYALEGSVAYSGAAIQWLRDNLQIISSTADSEKIAANVPDNGGVYFVPAFSGLFAPYWRSDARGVIVGLTAFHNKGHIVRAALEASAFQAKEVLDAMGRDFGIKISRLSVDGGMTANNLLMQFQSDILGVPVVCPVVRETTALGAALAAGLGIGVWKSVEEIRSIWESSSEWFPHMTVDTRESLCLQWSKAVFRTLNWIDPVNETSSSNAGDKTSSFNPPKLQSTERSEANGERESRQYPYIQIANGAFWFGVGAVFALLWNRARV